ncbi:MAG: VCBS repeat-containing protein [Lewinella sp.]|nr:VCBS repeat-containing protein [Lewinella sp.]
MKSHLILLAGLLIFISGSVSAQTNQWMYSPSGSSSYQNLAFDAEPMSNLRFGDFNGDGKTDVFKSTGGKWYYSPGGAGSWVVLQSNPNTVDKLAFGDFNGDHKTDVFYVLGGQWKYSSGGVAAWTNIAQAPGSSVENLAFGDFNGDGKTDVFTVTNGQWKYSSGGAGSWLNLAQDPSVSFSNLRFGDFNGDGKTDVFTVINGQWKYSSGGAGSWLNLAQDPSKSIGDLAFGDFNGDGKTDVFAVTNGQWKYSSGGTGGWQNLAHDPSKSINDLAFGDFNGDGKTDVFIAGGSNAAAAGNSSANNTNNGTGSNTGAGTPTVNTSGSWQMPFTNSGTKDVEIYRSSPTAIGEKVTTIVQGNTVDIPVKLGDQFAVKIDGRFDLHPTVFISDPEADGIEVFGNLPYSDLKSNGITYNLPDYYPNHIGIDLRTLNPRDLVNTINKAQIFESLNPVSDVDYYHIGNNIIKNGFLYYGLQLHNGSSETKMAYDYSSFSKDWSIGVGGAATVKGVSGSFDLNYSSFSNTERASESIYAYTREQHSVFGASVTPEKAQLSTAFKQAVKKITTKQQALDKIVMVYGTHYPKAITYGGDRSLFTKITKNEYNQVKGHSIDLKAEVSAANSKMSDSKIIKNATGKQVGSEATSSSTKSLGGSLSFSQSENQEVRNILQNTSIKYKMIGGNGGFDNWEVDEGTSAPIGVELGSLVDLIDIKVFKDGTDPALLAQKKVLIQQAIDQYLAGFPTVGVSLPTPVVYSVTFNKFKIVESDVDDTCGEMKGVFDVDFSTNGVEAQVYAAFNPSPLWQQTDWTDTYWFSEGNEYPINAKCMVVHYPDAAGNFAPLKVKAAAVFTEDDCAANPDDVMSGETTYLSMDTQITASQEYYFECIQPGYPDSQKIRVTFTVTREPSDFPAELVSPN